METRQIGKSVLENIAKGAKLAGRTAAGVARHIENNRVLYLSAAGILGGMAVGGTVGYFQEFANTNAHYDNIANGMAVGFIAGCCYDMMTVPALCMD